MIDGHSPIPAYAELHCHSYYSLLDAACSPETLVSCALKIGLTALALTDHDSLAGAVRFWTSAHHVGLHAVMGAEVTLHDGCHLTLLAQDQAGYANLCRLVTASRLDQLPPDNATWPGKIAPALAWAQLEQHRTGLIALSGCRRGPIAAPLLRKEPAQAQQALQRLVDIFGRQRLYIELQHHSLPDDDWLLGQMLIVARQFGLPTVATGNVHYATQAGCRLRDALIAIRHNQSLIACQKGGLLPGNSQFYLAGPDEMARRFRDLPQALTNSVEIARQCQVSLDFSHRRLPSFATPNGESEFAHLYQLCHVNLAQRYPHLRPAVLTRLAHELDVIEQAGLAGYFLIVWDIIAFARTRGIRCQGRGSAANSIVAYLLGITSIDPLQHNLLFERFLSADRFTSPDIDIDFAADRREEVIQYVYQRYGHAHAAMVCNAVTYRAPSALRDLGKALDFPVEAIARLGGELDTHSPAAVADHILATLSPPPSPSHPSALPNLKSKIQNPKTSPSHPLALLADLLRQIDGCPRHLSIHSGGMLITGLPLDEVVPLEPATMPSRIIGQWDKDSVEDAGLIKIDLLGLRMLGAIAEALEHIRAQEGEAPDLDALALDDPAIYAMLQAGDTVGAFQVESRAQQQMLPRLKPTCFEDIIVAIAIVRPGPIQGGAVHPYLRRRAGLEPVAYLHPCLASVLAETLGVLLFQEQAIRVAMVAGGFAPGEADLLRRALSRSRPGEEMARLGARFVQGAQAQGIEAGTAKAIFGQLAGYAGYGFCKSHAASFALIAYQSLWLKCYYPAAFYCALLNQQPMGFYSPEVLVGDARRHGVDLLPPDINRSDWRYSLEQTAKSNLALRTGLSAVHALGEQGWQRIAGARQAEPLAGLADLCRRTRLPKAVVNNLIRAGALDRFGERRPLLWQLGELEYSEDNSFALDMPASVTDLPPLDDLESTAWEYELLGLSPDTQLLAHYRPALRRIGVASTWQVKEMEAGRRVRVAGFLVVRQRPATAKGVVFLSLEDESGLLDGVVRPDVYSQLRDVLRAAPLLVVEGTVQRSDRAVSVLVYQAYPLLDYLSQKG